MLYVILITDVDGTERVFGLFNEDELQGYLDAAEITFVESHCRAILLQVTNDLERAINERG